MSKGNRNQNGFALIDSHAHLQDPRFQDDVDQVIARALKHGVEMIICVGYDIESSRAALDLARKHNAVKAVAGIHPHDAVTVNDNSLAELYQLAREPEVVAVGEIGLDFYRDLSPREDQKKGFVAQVRLAQEIGKPIVIHNRDAHTEILALIKKEKAGVNGGVMHCYSGHVPLAIDLMKEGFYISLAGPITFSNAKKAKEVAARIPMDWILVETDCPYLTPEPKRGKRNEPMMVVEVAKKVAEIKGKTCEEVAYITNRNTRKVFGIK